MWEAIEANKRKSVFLILIMGIFMLSLGGVFAAAWFGGKNIHAIVMGILLAFGLWLILTLVALSSGQSILLSIAGAREVTHDDAPQLFNIVEEMKIAAQLEAMPKIYVVEDRSPNAFAVGTHKNCAVAATTGLLSVLTRDELQGVIAHEIGHIKNQDTKFMAIASVMLGTIVILSEVFLRGSFYGAVFGGGSRRRSSNNNDGGGGIQIIIMILALVLAILAPILAQLLYFACSRSREFLADASSAVFTRYPEGLASALEKISRPSAPMESANKVTAPMYIVNPLMKAHGGSSSVFSTHPATKDRVKILRTMGNAGLGSYDEAYKSCMNSSSGVIGKQTLRDSQELELRGIQSSSHNRKQQTRDANDILHKLNKLLFIPCSCGLTMKLPKGFKSDSIKCPRCGKLHSITEVQQ